MVKHISKVIKETELYKELERKKLAKLEEFLPGVSKFDLIEKALYQPVSRDVSEIEHKKSTEKPHSNE